ncbi:hypothetical protein APHAL10511_003971 [Amanita phalloides]|nr:hypothetical protein APHAL10511_003971 [Amanita phalloides]
MAACNVCLNNVTSPVCLPCGHIFCNDCISRAIRAIAPFTTMHHCPSCQVSYNAAVLNPATVPPQLRAHLLPSIRKLQLSGPSAAAQAPAASGSDLQTENARLRAEKAALQKNCAMWRKRAEAHSSSTLGLLQMMRMTQDQAVLVACQRDELRRKCDILQRRLYGDDTDAEDDDDDDDADEEDDGDENLLGIDEPFLPSTLLSQVDKQRLSVTPPSAISLSSSPNVLGSTSLKRVRTPYDSPCESDAEEDERIRKRLNRGSASTSSLPSI